MKTRSKKRRPPATMMADLEKALRPILGPVLKEHSRTGGPLSDQTKADLDKALRPVIQQIKQQMMETGSTEPIILGIKVEPEPEPAEAAIGMFDHVVEHCYDTIVKVALEGDETGQPYVVAMEEIGPVGGGKAEVTAGLMFVESADKYFAQPDHTPEIREAWAELKVEMAKLPHTIPVIIHSRTFEQTTFRLITRP